MVPVTILRGALLAVLGLLLLAGGGMAQSGSLPAPTDKAILTISG